MLAMAGDASGRGAGPSMHALARDASGAERLRAERARFLAAQPAAPDERLADASFWDSVDLGSDDASSDAGADAAPPRAPAAQAAARAGASAAPRAAGDAGRGGAAGVGAGMAPQPDPVLPQGLPQRARCEAPWDATAEAGPPSPAPCADLPAPADALAAAVSELLVQCDEARPSLLAALAPAAPGGAMRSSCCCSMGVGQHLVIYLGYGCGIKTSASLAARAAASERPAVRRAQRRPSASRSSRGTCAPASPARRAWQTPSTTWARRAARAPLHLSPSGRRLRDLL